MKKIPGIAERARRTIAGSGKPLKTTKREMAAQDTHSIDASLSAAERSEFHSISHLGFLMLLQGRSKEDQRVIRDWFEIFEFKRVKQGKWSLLPSLVAGLRKVYGDPTKLATLARLRQFQPELYGTKSLEYLERRERAEAAKQLKRHKKL